MRNRKIKMTITNELGEMMPEDVIVFNALRLLMRKNMYKEAIQFKEEWKCCASIDAKLNITRKHFILSK